MQESRYPDDISLRPSRLKSSNLAFNQTTLWPHDILFSWKQGLRVRNKWSLDFPALQRLKLSELSISRHCFLVVPSPLFNAVSCPWLLTLPHGVHSQLPVCLLIDYWLGNPIASIWLVVIASKPCIVSIVALVHSDLWTWYAWLAAITGKYRWTGVPLYKQCLPGVKPMDLAISSLAISRLTSLQGSYVP